MKELSIIVRILLFLTKFFLVIGISYSATASDFSQGCKVALQFSAGTKPDSVQAHFDGRFSVEINRVLVTATHFERIQDNLFLDDELLNKMRDSHSIVL